MHNTNFWKGPARQNTNSSQRGKTGVYQGFLHFFSVFEVLECFVALHNQRWIWYIQLNFLAISQKTCIDTKFKSAYNKEKVVWMGVCIWIRSIKFWRKRCGPGSFPGNTRSFSPQSRRSAGSFRSAGRRCGRLGHIKANCFIKKMDKILEKNLKEKKKKKKKEDEDDDDDEEEEEEE